MKSETVRKVENCFERLEMVMRNTLAGPTLTKALAEIGEEKRIAIEAVRAGEPTEDRRSCGCLETFPIDNDTGQCLGCGKVLVRG